jgi:outer membrane lipoprotein SlyB
MSNISQAGASVVGAKTLWTAIGALGVAVVGLGGALYYVQAQRAPEKQAPAVVATPATTAPAGVSQPTADKKSAHTEPKPAVVAKPSAKPALSPLKTPAPVPAETRPVCTDCATVTAVTPVEREGQARGAGAVAGGVLGALVGNQIGQGQGKDVATIIGAVGGGIAGNQIEKKMKKVTVYQVTLRMDDGSTRTLEQAAPASMGARVRVDGDTLSPLPAN